MTIRQKIKLSNVAMALIPILLTAVIIVVCLQTSLGSYWYTLETMYKDENGIQSAQSLIYTYQQELWESNWSQGIHTQASEGIWKNEKMNHLEKKLSGMGYHFQIKKNGNKIYSNISEEEMQTAVSVAGTALESAKTLTASYHDVSVIKHTFYHGEKIFSIIAVHNGVTGQETVSYLQNYILKYIAGFVLVFLALTVCVNMILSYWISKSVLIPLKKLSWGTKEIREGNLNTVIEYTKDDEFGEVCRDFDEMRAHLKESVEQRLKDEQRKKDLIIGISHDLRTPLTSISGYVDGLLEGIANTQEKRKRYLEAIRTRTKDLARLVDSLSEYNRLDSSKFRYHLEPEDLKVFISQYLAACEEEARQNNVKIQLISEEGNTGSSSSLNNTTYDSVKKYPVLIDRNEMKRVLDNLFTNTIRYRTKPYSKVTISLRRIENSAVVEFVFSDDGPGVPKESLERIFESFYRVDGARSNAGEGSGIGLAVVKEIIAGHKGIVHAENRGGLAIIIHLPCIPLNADRETHSELSGADREQDLH